MHESARTRRWDEGHHHRGHQPIAIVDGASVRAAEAGVQIDEAIGVTGIATTAIVDGVTGRAAEAGVQIDEAIGVTGIAITVTTAIVDGVNGRAAEAQIDEAIGVVATRFFFE